MKAIVQFIGILLTAGLVMAQGEFSAPVLLVNPDARLIGTGGAGVALADDISAVYLNPAGLGFQHNGEFAAHYSKLLPGLYDQFDYLSIAWKGPVRDYGTFGVALRHYSLGGGDIMHTDGTVLGDYNSSETVVTISHGHNCFPDLGLAFGANAKILFSNLASGDFDPSIEGDGSAFAVMFDLAALWQSPMRNINIADRFSLAPFDFAMTFANFGTRLDYSDGNHRDPLPLTWRLGMAYHHLLPPDHQLEYLFDLERIMTSIDADADADMAIVGFFSSFGNEEFMKRINLKLGTEYAFRQMFFGRAGVNLNPIAEKTSFNLGFGVIYNNIKFDFADEIGTLNNSLRLSVAYLL
ncbi:MAG: PorV/PorQ family protein [Candidatus Delongbacteria bacterium]|nr:PorV/PorQ family protein [Candidatus Delongbacteria bacterium]